MRGPNSNLIGDIDLIPIAISYEKVVDEHSHVKVRAFFNFEEILVTNKTNIRS